VQGRDKPDFPKKEAPFYFRKQKFCILGEKPFFERKAHIEVPDSKLLAPDKETIQQLVCKTYGITKEELIKSKRGLFNEPRGVAIYLTRMIRSDGLIDICRDYNLKKYSSASSVVDVVKQRLSKDRKFRSRVENLSEKLIKGQSVTSLSRIQRSQGSSEKTI
jgi:putative transposase